MIEDVVTVSLRVFGFGWGRGRACYTDLITRPTPHASRPIDWFLCPSLCVFRWLGVLTLAVDHVQLRSWLFEDLIVDRTGAILAKGIVDFHQFLQCPRLTTHTIRKTRHGVSDASSHYSHRYSTIRKGRWATEPIMRRPQQAGDGGAKASTVTHLSSVKNSSGAIRTGNKTLNVRFLSCMQRNASLGVRLQVLIADLTRVQRNVFFLQQVSGNVHARIHTRISPYSSKKYSCTHFTIFKAKN